MALLETLMKILIHEKPDRAEEILSILKQLGVEDVQLHWGRKTLASHMEGV